ncbi:hypothetical protein SCHIN_v1c03420 [Spiroplasma chinense]|uniref:Uncharacterized protein n=1 Tax=Spiroplasma chinense TaxID=216932 RepID=A0A5B9Y4D1_9MOLU|nr:hypothetical protein [Spiroplasma chinense]QEH61539.1 hypothetical protein SCHIN_v1c03420 [Spiroplasma chinense]
MNRILNIFSLGINKQVIKFDIRANAATDFYASQSINTTIEVNLTNITEKKTKIEGVGQYIDIYGTVGTSKVEASFVSSIYRDNTFIYVEFDFHLGIGAAATRYVSMKAEADNLRFS